MFNRSTLTAIVAAALLSVSANAAYTTKVVGNTGVSAQLMFLQSNGQVAILDKAENNPAQQPGNGSPAYGVFYNYYDNTFQATTVRSNTFCAGGAMLGDGSWIVTGGNGHIGPYTDDDGGHSLRILAPCSGNNCQWNDDPANQMNDERWYPSVEPMRDGHVLIAGGMIEGGFVSNSDQNQASYEFYPNLGASNYLPILARTVPISLYPILFLMSDDRVFIAARQEAVLWNMNTQTETVLNDVPVTSRNYPASGGSAMLPMIPDNNYAQTIILCGGNELGSDANWGNGNGPMYPDSTEKKASTDCSTITPLTSAAWKTVDPLPQGRTMGQFVILPDGTLWFGMGGLTGVAGYTTDPNAPSKPVDYSLADNAVEQVYIYTPSARKGLKWKKAGTLNVARLYHSTATLLPDSSILVAGSNPNPDVTLNVKYPTEYRAERWYPTYYNSARPSNAGLPTAFGYGGAGFTLTMKSSTQAKQTKVVIIRTGFATHGLSMGQRSITLKTVAKGKTVTVSPLPGNPSMFAPGTALAFVVVNGIPSQGVFVTVGNGQIGDQPVGSTGNTRVIVPAYNNTERVHAQSVASKVSGSPINGVRLPLSAEGTYQHINQTYDAEWKEEQAGMKNGTIEAGLGG